MTNDTIPMKLLATFLALLGSLYAHGQGLIWSANNFAANSGAPGANWNIAFDHVSDQSFHTPPSLNPVSRIFSMSLSTNDAGRTFFANALNEPGFYGFVAGLTDGVNGYLRFQDGDPSAWRAQSEQNFLGRTALAPDLAGYNITQIGFQVDSFYDFYNASEDVYFRRLDYTLNFYGAPVPEPSTWVLAALGAVALMFGRKACERGRVSRN